MELTATATFCATVVDEWVRAGVTAAFVAPGSRSTPLALALVADVRITTEVFHDERSASFAALGHGVATGRPAVLLCTSGTAAAHFHAAVIEAGLSGVPMLVCTADRPPELWDIGAAQTVDQTNLYGGAVRWFAEPGVPDGSLSPGWRSLASRAVAEAFGWSGRPGPVHLNLSFREPLVGVPDELPEGRPDGAPWHQVLTGPAAASAALLAARMVGQRGVIVAGRDVEDADVLLGLAERLGWPVLADHRSGCRVAGRSVSFADALLRSPTFAAAHRPDVVLRVGEPPASKVLNQWLAASGADQLVVMPGGRWVDPDRRASVMVRGEGIISALIDLVAPIAAGQRHSWMAADEVAGAVIRSELGSGSELTEPQVAVTVLESMPSGGALVVSSSMPVRDVEWFAPARADVRVLVNRGANGIDGVISTAIGVALTGAPTVCLVGDVAFLHDSAGLVAIARRDIDLTLVVVDNDGGGIFSFLPQASALDPTPFERVFGTPHGTSIATLAEAHGIPASVAVSADDLRACFPPKGVHLVLVRTGRASNVEVHQRINAAVVSAIGSALT